MHVFSVSSVKRSLLLLLASLSQAPYQEKTILQLLPGTQLVSLFLSGR